MSTATIDATDQLDSLMPEEVDPEAPYGRRANGTPYKRSPEWRAKTTATLKQMQGTAQVVAGATARANGAKKPGRPPKAAAEATDYTAGILGLVQVAAFPLGLLAPINPTFQLDAVTLIVHGPNVATALNAAAQENDQLAAILDKILAVGPWGALLGALMPLALQLAANHGLVPAGPSTMTLTPEQLAEHAERLQAQARAAATAPPVS